MKEIGSGIYEKSRRNESEERDGKKAKGQNAKEYDNLQTICHASNPTERIMQMLDFIITHTSRLHIL